MTAPLASNPPPPGSPVPTPAEPLVVRPDRARARRWLVSVLVLNGGLAAASLAGAIWAAGATGAWWGGLAFGITLTGCVFQMTFHAFAYGRILGAETIATIGPDGIRGPTTRWERVELPWPSIGSVTDGWNAVVVTPVPGAGPKLVIPTRAADQAAPTVRAAIAHFSGARL